MNESENWLSGTALKIEPFAIEFKEGEEVSIEGKFLTKARKRTIVDDSKYYHKIERGLKMKKNIQPQDTCSLKMNQILLRYSNMRKMTTKKRPLVFRIPHHKAKSY